MEHSVNGQKIDFMTPVEVAEYMRVSLATVYRWVKNKRITSYRLGKRIIRINRYDIKKLKI